MSTATRIPIHIPTPLRPYAAQQGVVEVEAETVGQALRELVTRHAAPPAGTTRAANRRASPRRSCRGSHYSRIESWRAPTVRNLS